MAKQWGVASYEFLDIPHPIANLTEVELDQRVDGLVEDVITLLSPQDTLTGTTVP